MLSAAAAALAIASMCLLLRAMVSYFIAKPLSGSTAPVFGTRSRTCPYEASISKSLPRYFCSVLALAGDSTIRRLDAMRMVFGSMQLCGVRRGKQFFYQQRIKVLMAVPQYHQHDQFEFVQREVLMLQRDRAVHDHLALDGRDQMLLFGEHQELTCFIADALLLQLCKMPLSGVLKSGGVAVRILLLQRGQPGQRLADVVVLETGGGKLALQLVRFRIAARVEVTFKQVHQYFEHDLRGFIEFVDTVRRAAC